MHHYQKSELLSSHNQGREKSNPSIPPSEHLRLHLQGTRNLLGHRFCALFLEICTLFLFSPYPLCGATFRTKHPLKSYIPDPLYLYYSMPLFYCLHIFSPCDATAAAGSNCSGPINTSGRKGHNSKSYPTLDIRICTYP